MDGSRRTLGRTLTTETALLMVYVSEIVLYRDCLKLAYLKALATSDTSVGASLTCHASLVLVDTADAVSYTHLDVYKRQVYALGA